MNALPSASSSAAADELVLTDGEAQRLLRIARLNVAAVRRAGQAPPRSEEAEGSAVQTVNITVYLDHRLLGSQSGCGPTLEDAVRNGAARTALDKRFPADTGERELLTRARVDLWVRTDRVRLTGADEVALLDLGLDGVELQVGDNLAYYKPSVPLTSHVPDSEQLLDKLAKKAGLPPSAWRLPGAKIWRTRWEHWVDPGEIQPGLWPLRRLRSITEIAVDRYAITTALMYAQDRLLAVQDTDGMYLYRYQPFRNRVLPGPIPLVRQAGCASAMAWSAAHAAAGSDRREQLASSARCAVGWLLAHTSRSGNGEVALDHPDAATGPRPGALGSVALTALALEFGAEAAPEVRPSLIATLRGRQNADGSFRCFSNTTNVDDDGGQQNYYPGEAMLALAHAAKRGDSDARDAVRRAFCYYRDRFRERPRSGFVVWQAAAWRTLLEAHCDAAAEEYAQFVLEIVDWVTSRQLDAENATHPDYVGGFAIGATGLPNFSTATFTEATVHGLAVATLIGDDAHAERYRRAVGLGLRFVLKLQIAPALASLFPDPGRTCGATPFSLSDFLLRSDFDQHAIMAMLAALTTAGALS